jgi:hypothetical protein
VPNEVISLVAGVTGWTSNKGYVDRFNIQIQNGLSGPITTIIEGTLTTNNFSAAGLVKGKPLDWPTLTFTTINGYTINIEKTSGANSWDVTVTW